MVYSLLFLLFWSLNTKKYLNFLHTYILNIYSTLRERLKILVSRDQNDKNVQA